MIDTFFCTHGEFGIECSPEKQSGLPHQLRILLVEDEKPIRDIVVLTLLCAGFDCREAASGREAIDLLHSGVRINLILSNMLLPEVDGLTLLLYVKKHYPNIPFVFVTAIEDTSVREAVIREGAEAYLLKPFDRQQLLTVVHRVLGNAELLSTDW